jgi:dethiobiotin synthase
MSVFVTGTDTGVGKTLVSALLLRRYGGDVPLGYWKPIATGSVEGRDTEWVRRRAGHAATIAEERYLFRPPVSPHLAARRAGARISPSSVVKAFAGLRRANPALRWVIEGAGGLLVPLTDRGYLLADLIAELELPALIVARSTLGTINHTLLSVEAARARGIPVLGVVLNGPANPENARAIERFGKVRVIGQLPPARLRDLRTFDRLTRDLDRAGRLLPALRRLS